jgi:hypothetical protein
MRQSRGQLRDIDGRKTLSKILRFGVGSCESTTILGAGPFAGSIGRAPISSPLRSCEIFVGGPEERRALCHRTFRFIMITILPIYYDRNPHFRHEVVCSRSITPLTCGCHGRRLKPPARATSKNFYKIFQRLHDCKNFSETSERSRQPGHIGFSPVFRPTRHPPHPLDFPLPNAACTRSGGFQPADA